MAKSKSFFGLRRGSTKSHTYSILNGQQITKDRVQTVANPKTQKQQFQRAIMATVMAAYSEMKAIEDHAFEGKKKGSECQREFMSRNLVAMRNAFKQYQDGGVSAGSQEFFAVGPKTPTVLPAAWIISHGTLENTESFVYEENGHLIRIPLPPLSEAGSGGKTLNYGVAADAMGIVPGMVVTFLCITRNSAGRIFSVADEDYAGYNDFKFGYCRYVVSQFDRSKDITSATGDATAVAGLVYEFLEDIADARSTSSFVDSLENIVVNGNYLEGDAELILSGAGFDETLTLAIGSITSMVDEDLRSTSQMTVRKIDNAGAIVGLDWQYVPAAWQNAGGSLGQSDLYLEGGSV